MEDDAGVWRDARERRGEERRLGGGGEVGGGAAVRCCWCRTVGCLGRTRAQNYSQVNRKINNKKSLGLAAVQAVKRERERSDGWCVCGMRRGRGSE